MVLRLSVRMTIHGRHWRFLAALLLAPVAWLAPQGAQAQTGTVAVTARRVIDGTGRLLENATVVVEGGRITSVGPRPAQYRGPVIDLG